MTRPGVRLRAFAARVCSEKTMERLIDPVLADFQAERDTEFPPTASVQRLMFYLVPTILPLSVPIGLAMGIALAASGRALSRRLIATIVLVALVTSAGSVAVLGWLTPITNQLYREAIVGGYVVKGDREFTFPELNRLVQPHAWATGDAFTPLQLIRV